ncbi:N-acetyltransferase family protein [Sphingobacterium sp. LRF_L2]|uniref:GNAT family N-acetyltransferase n=1 Tax=Sphingobacterium sp. LRF_L2 TaxID=3369421 RepID=UPI003F6397E1
MLQIRKATLADAYSIAPLMLMAMEEITYHFIGERNQIKALEFLRYHIALPNNQYSYEHIFVVEESGEIIGQLCLYPGHKLPLLQEPVLSYLETKLQRSLSLPAETQAGEIYIDSIAISNKAQGRGIGKMLLLYVIDIFVKKDKQILGLLVDKENQKATSLYISLGFKPIDTVYLFNKEFQHLQHQS